MLGAMVGTKKILMVLTSHARLGDTGQRTGFWLEEFAAPYYAFKDAGAVITLASPEGGKPPIDPKSDEPGAQTDATRRLCDDAEAQAALGSTQRIAGLDASDYDAVFYPGGHGPLWDLAVDEHSIRLVESFWRQGKPVSAVCHASAVLLNAKDEGGLPIVRNRDVAGFTNSEEAAVGLTDVVPLLVEDALIDRGGRFSRGADWAAHVARDGKLVTGQNPASSVGVATQVLELL